MPRPEERPDEGKIHAWLDGELSPEESARVERLVRENVAWAAAAAEARGFVAASSRILGALDVVAGDVIPIGTRAAPMPAAPVARPRFVVRGWMKAAAGLVLVAGTAWVVTSGEFATRATSADAVLPVATTSQVMPPSAATSTDASPPERARVQQRAEEETAKAATQRAAKLADAQSERREFAKAGEESFLAGVVVTGVAEPSAPRQASTPVPAPSPAAGVALRSRENALARTRAAETAAADLAGVAGGRGSGEVAPVPTLALEGCWRSRQLGRTDARDTTLVAPRVLSVAPDSTTLVLVVDGRAVRFSTQRVDCPRPTPPVPPR